MATLIQTLPFLVDGLLMTLLVSACVIVLSLIVGLPLGCVLAFGPLWARVPIRLYADFVRGVPILVLLYFVYYGLPAIKVNLPSLLAAIVALGASFFVGWGIPVAVVAVIAAIMSLRRPVESRAIARWALVLGLCATVYSLGWLVWAGMQFERLG